MSIRQRLAFWLLLLGAVVTVLGAGAVSASAAHGPETRVRAIPTATVAAVGLQSGETAGHFGCLRTPALAIVSGSCVATKSIPTPYGAADQGLDAASVAARSQVEGGATVYRVGTTGRSAGPEGQFWSLEHPSTPGYASRYGLPAENVANADFIESAIVTPGSPFGTRAAPGIGDIVGGGIEVVVKPGGVTMCGFSYLGPKSC